MQGNVVTKEQVARVKPGMTREQVRDVLGSPLLTSAFHADRWDYVFTMRRQGTEPQRRSVVACFKGDELERLEAPELPSEKRVRRLDRAPVQGRWPRSRAGADRRATQGAAAAGQAARAPPRHVPLGADRAATRRSSRQ